MAQSTAKAVAVMVAIIGLGGIAGLGSTAPAMAAQSAPRQPGTSAQAPSITWSKSARVAGNGYGGLEAVSCPTTTDCMAIDAYGDAVTWNGKRWSPPATAIRNATRIVSLSCPSAGFCAAAGDGLWTGHGTWWTMNAPPLRDIWDSVSCVAATFCAAATIDGYVSEYHGRGWSAPVQIDNDAPGIMNVSCTSATRCFAMDGYGTLYAWNGTKWSATAGYDKYATLTCAPGRFCMVVDNGTTYTFNGSSWKAENIGPATVLGYLSCGSATFCMYLDEGTGTAFSYSGKAWRHLPEPVLTTQAGDLFFGAGLACSRQTCAAVAGTPASTANVYLAGAWRGAVAVDDSGELDSVSCLASGFCAADGMSGNAVIHRGGRWGRPVVLPTARGVSSVSCTSATFCLASDVSGHAWRYTGTRWVKAPAPAVPGGYMARVSAVSCIGPRFCAWAGDGLTVFNGTRWTASVQVYGDWLAVSCASATSCVAGDLLGEVSVFNGKDWSALAQATPAYQSIQAISCTSARFCAATTDTGLIGIFNGAKWAWKTITASGLTGVSCTSSRFCVALDAFGHDYTFNGVQWSKPGSTHLRSNAIQEAVSCTSARFCLAVDSLGDVTTGT